MRILFLGTGAFGIPTLEQLRAAGHEIVGVISQPDRPAGRGLHVAPTPIHVAADALGLRHVQTADVNGLNLRELFNDTQDQHRERKRVEFSAPADIVSVTGSEPRAQASGVRRPDIGVVVAFGQKLKAPILAGPAAGCINLHASLLPKYRGAAPIQWAIINEEPTTGVTIFQLDPAWDAGAIWSQRETPIGDTETGDELHDRLAQLGAELMLDTLATFERGELRPQAQDPALATRAPKLSKADAQIDWSHPAARIVRRIHGLWSWPAATCLFTSHQGKREVVQLARAQVIEPHAPPTAEFPAGAFHADRTVQTGAGRVKLLEVKPAGGKLMPFDAFANGRRIAPPDRLLPST